MEIETPSSAAVTEWNRPALRRLGMPFGLGQFLFPSLRENGVEEFAGTFALS